MKLEKLRVQVLEANLEVVRRGLVLYTFGNASGISREARPGRHQAQRRSLRGDEARTDGDHRSGRQHRRRRAETFLRSGHAPVPLPSLSLDRRVVHTHSRFATAWAQAGREIPCLGTTHADYFQGPVPVTEPMSAAEIESDYEWNTGQAIVRRFASLDPEALPSVLVAGHAPFCWGPTPAAAAHNAVILEEVAWMAYHTLLINSAADSLSDTLRDKHFLRKHGPSAYYGQK